MFLINFLTFFEQIMNTGIGSFTQKMSQKIIFIL